MSRFIIALTVAAAIAVGLSGAAQAAPPVNDDFDNATVITALPFTDSIDMSEATVAPDDPLPSCADPLVGNGPGTAWYSLTLDHDAQIAYDALGSSFEPGVVVYTGSRGSLTEVQCSGGFFPPLLSATANVTYHFFIQNFNALLVFNVREILPPATITLQINPSGSVKSGVARVTGTVTCSRDATASVSIDLSQVFRRLVAQGTSPSFSTACSPSGTSWSVAVSSSTFVLFGPGLALSHANGVTCADLGCNTGEANQTVRLRAAPK